MISFISHIRFDTPEREKNCKLVYNYYTSLFAECEFIFVEEGIEKKLQNILDLRPQDKHLFFQNKNVYRKCKGYNLGAKNAKNNNLIFIDIDTIVSKLNIEKSLQAIDDEKVIICYNGTALYFNFKAKEKIKKLSYEELELALPLDFKENCHVNYKAENFIVGNTRAVGGCLHMTKKCFSDINGFNEHFIGWGYEDNEIVFRSKNLGKELLYINTIKPYLFHLPHDLVDRDKSDHVNYRENEQIFYKVKNMSKQQLIEYIKTW